MRSIPFAAADDDSSFQLFQDNATGLDSISKLGKEVVQLKGQLAEARLKGIIYKFTY